MPTVTMPVKVAALRMPDNERMVRKWGTVAQRRLKTATVVIKGPAIGESNILRRFIFCLAAIVLTGRASYPVTW
jgi:hypothetical protein